MRVYCDIETRSRVDLRKTGVYRYAACPDFRILMSGWRTDDRPTWATLGQDDTLDTFREFQEAGATFVAHNAQFERVCFSYALGLPGYLSPEQFHDTRAIAGQRGFPQTLKNLALVLGAEEKDEAGTRLINLFCKPRRDGGWNDETTHPMEWLDFISYCIQDVDTLYDIDQRLGSDHITPMEKAVFLADQRVNDLGIEIDVPMATAAVAAAEENQARQKARVTELSGVENPGSVQQMSAWLRDGGVEVPNLQAQTVENLLAGDEVTPVQREALELRQELALAASKKFASALSAVLPDGRLRGTLQYFGAHTGRWAGRGTQVQNLPRLAFDTEAETNLAILDLLLGNGASSEDLKKMVRPLFKGPFTVVDYSAIEARVVAWLAGEQWALDAFAEGRDIYVETANRMSTANRPLNRSQGKVAVLALGYNGGTNSLRAMGAEGSDEDLQLLVDQWRKANPNIVRLWQLLGDAFADPGRAAYHLRTTTSMNQLGRSVHLHLPSGRSISYHGTAWERYRVQDPKTGAVKWKEGWRYANPKEPFNRNMRIGTYGGRICENATQAVARDIMAEAIVRLQDEGYDVVAHVHDEIIVEGENDVDKISEIMCRLPDWATGLPVDGEGDVMERYRK